MPPKKKIFNPFDGRNQEEVWDEIRRKSKPISREDALRRIKKAQSQIKSK